MALNYINGNILDIDSGVIVQQVNCQNAMGAGLAKQITAKWPVVSERYHRFCESKRDPHELNGICLPVTVAPGITVVNIFSQFYYGNAARTGKCYTNYGMLIDGIRRVCEKYSGQRIYIPYGIGCGLAGGDWSVVEARLAELGVDVTIVRLR